MKHLKGIWLFIGLFSFVSCWTDGEFPGEEQPECRDATCLDRLDVYISRIDGEEFLPGEYAFLLIPSLWKEQNTQCTLSANSKLACSGDRESLSITLDNGDPRTFHVYTDGAPTSLEIHMSFEDIWSDHQTISPDYNIVTPNGPNCDPICFQATITLYVRTTANANTGELSLSSRHASDL